ncbi:MAG: lamin tail domain-containing protein, partial [Gemmatimonadales bacterium]
SISRNTVLRFDPSQAGTTLTATHAWDLTADLPVVGANLGIEAIAWVPDSFLVSRGFRDEVTGSAYSPAAYPNHGGGLFFVGVEGNGRIYAYALNHSTNGFTRIATIESGFVGVMDLNFDRELGYLWAVCDDGCQGRTATLEIDTQAGSTSQGRFVVTELFERPASMPNLNNEGFAVAPQSACVAGMKPVFWADDSETEGHAIRRASLPCARFP